MRAKVFILGAAFLLVAAAQEIRLTSGPVDNQVFQRSADQTADISFSGAASGKKVNGKEVEARLVAADSNPLPGFDWSSVAKIQKLKWGGELKRIPVGGPYRLEIRLQAATPLFPSQICWSAIFGFWPANPTWKAMAI